MRDFGLLLLFLAFCVALFSKEINVEIDKKFEAYQQSHTTK